MAKRKSSRKTKRSVPVRSRVTRSRGWDIHTQHRIIVYGGILAILLLMFLTTR